jgi:hypothetical protein
MAEDLEEMSTFRHQGSPAMKVWPHEDAGLSSKAEETRLGWMFIAGLAFFLFVLLAVGSLLRFIW